MNLVVYVRATLLQRSLRNNFTTQLKKEVLFITSELRVKYATVHLNCQVKNASI